MAISDLQQAAEALTQNELVVFPTETVYGLGARADSSEAIQKIYQAKGRPSNNPLIIHFHSISQIKEWLTLSPLAEKLGKKFWPGPLTLIIPSSNKIVKEARAGLDTVAIRIPQHPLALELLRTVNLPLAAPSANRSGHISPTMAEHAKVSLGNKVKVILDGGACPVGLESTVLDLSTPIPRILRPGKISQSEIEYEIGKIENLDHKRHSHETLSSPGLLSKHYAPDVGVFLKSKTEIETLYKSENPENKYEKKIGILSHSIDPLFFSNSKVVKNIPLSSHPKNYAQALYAALYELEKEGCDCIFIEEVPSLSEWQAVINRLSRMVSE